jgi:hypothetical protein
MKFLDRDPSLEQLARRSGADLAWCDEDGAAMFLWVLEQPGRDNWTLTMDRAYWIEQDSKMFWGFLDRSSGVELEAPNPIRQFMTRKFMRQTFNCPTVILHDGDNTVGEVLDARRDARAVLKVVYVSSAGRLPQQEESRTYVFYRDLEGHYQLAAGNVGHEGAYASGAGIQGDFWNMRVIWNAPGEAAPFHVAVKRGYWAVRSYNAPRAIPEFTLWQDGVLTGPFPMKLSMSSARYFEGDGETSLERLAGMMENTPEEVHLRLESLQRLNPGLAVGAPVPMGARVMVRE